MLKNTLDAVHQNIMQLESQFGRVPNSVKILAVSKTQPIERIHEAWQCGQKAFGENYLQEALLKIEALKHTGIDDIEWHFIGPIQSNKTRLIAENFSWVHSVERLSIAQRLNDQRPKHLPPLNVCIQINISQEITKSGVAPDEALSLVQAIQALSKLKLRGLMVIPQSSLDFDQQRESFRKLRVLFEKINQTLPGSLDTLSMGMSDDYAAAIAEGATIVRLGSVLFGRRE